MMIYHSLVIVNDVKANWQDGESKEQKMPNLSLDAAYVVNYPMQMRNYRMIINSKLRSI
jgi:hypothetical protein